MIEILTAEQLAEKLSLHIETVRKMTREGLLPYHRIGAQNIRYSMADVLAHTAVNKHPDDEAVDRFAAAMQAKMASARAKGKEGWDDPARCSTTQLHALLCEGAAAFDWVDVANYAMMLWAREQAK